MSPDREPRQHTSPVVASPPVPAGNIGDESAQSSPLLQDKLAQPVACIRGTAMNPAIRHIKESIWARPWHSAAIALRSRRNTRLVVPAVDQGPFGGMTFSTI